MQGSKIKFLHKVECFFMFEAAFCTTTPKSPLTRSPVGLNRRSVAMDLLLLLLLHTNVTLTVNVFYSCAIYRVDKPLQPFICFGVMQKRKQKAWLTAQMFFFVLKSSCQNKCVSTNCFVVGKTKTN